MGDLHVEPLEELSAGLRGRRVLLDAPARRNALRLETVEALHTLVTTEVDDPLVLASSTPGIFCAGADLTLPDPDRARLSDLLYEVYEAMIRRPGPILAVVEGPAVGGGAQLTTAADLRIAAPAARWRWAGPGHGLAVGAWILPHLVGRSRALDLTLTGRWLAADEAVSAGFATAAADDVWATATDVLHRLAKADAGALARVKAVASHDDLLTALAAERRLNRESWSGSAPHPHEAAAEHRHP